MSNIGERIALHDVRLWSAVVVGVLARLLWIYWNPHLIVWDEVAYQQLAVQLASGQPYGLQFWPPGWPMVLGVLYSIFGSNVMVAVWFNFFLSVATIILVGLISYQFWGRTAAIISLWLVGLMPSYIVTNVLLMYEVWLQFLLVLGLWLSLKSPWSPWRALLIGAITAVTCLMRPLWIVLPVLLWLCSRVVKPIRSTHNGLILAQTTAIVLLLPWTIYVSSLAGRFVPIALNGGMNLWIGNNPHATGTYMDPPAVFWDFRNDGLAQRQAIEFIVHQPWIVVKQLPLRLLYMLNVEHPVRLLLAKTRFAVSPAFVTLLRLLLNVSYWFILSLASCSLLLLARRNQWHFLLPGLLFVYNTITYLPFFGTPRFRWPVEFLLIIYAAAFVVMVCRPSLIVDRSSN